jgi:hypothetical protein
MSDEVDEMSAASRGSQPVAWAVTPGTLLAGRAWRVTLDKGEADRLSCGAMRVVPLYEQPQPTLTDEERWAITEAAGAYFDNDDDQECAKIASTLHGLLKRLG